MSEKRNGSAKGWENLFRDRNVHFLPDWIRDLYFAIITPAVKFAIKLKLHPNFFTILGLLLGVVAAFFLAYGRFFWGGFFILLSGCCDVFDGMVARSRGIGTKFGALFDSTLDRYTEIFVLLGVSYHFIAQDMLFTSLVSLLALAGSLMVSYVRARAEGLGLECKIGIMQRPERIVYMGFGGMAGQVPFIVVLYAIALLANFTAVQRVIHVWRATREEREHARETAEKQEKIPHYNNPPANLDN